MPDLPVGPQNYTVHPDGTITFSIIEDAPGGYPPAKPVYAPPASGGGSSVTSIILGVIMALTVVGLLAWIFWGDGPKSDPIPSREELRRTAPIVPGGVPVS